MAKIDFRWSWTVCSDSDIRRASSEVSQPVASWPNSSLSRGLSPLAEANNATRPSGDVSSTETAMSLALETSPCPIRAARRVTHRPSDR